MTNLEYTPDVAAATEEVYERLKDVVPPIEWPVHAPLIVRIRELKRTLNATILAHNYQRPEVFHGVADFTGDSLALARAGAAAEAPVIVVCGVHFMAESVKLLSPRKKVLLPDMRAGCSLAESITAEDVRCLRKSYPGVPVVSYVNTPASVKAESDICCTSANAVKVVESLGVTRVILVPDEFLALHVASKTSVEIITWKGHCEVHERFSASEIRSYRRQYQGIEILAHPECRPSVLAEADFVGSTSAMIRYVESVRPERVMLVTECSMSDNVAVSCPDVEFVRPCALCPHMKRITLLNVYESLLRSQYSIEISPSIARPAARAIEEMMAVGS